MSNVYVRRWKDKVIGVRERYQDVVMEGARSLVKATMTQRTM